MTEVIPKKKEMSAPQRNSAGTEEPQDGARLAPEKGDHGPIMTVPNCITFGRILLLIPLFYFLKQGEEGHGNFWALVIIGAALISDLLDGILARILKKETDWGRVFDPLADKVWIAGLGIFLALPWRQNPLPWGFLALVLIRDILIITAGIHAYKKRGLVLESNMWGKWAVFLTALTLLAYTIDFKLPGRFPWIQSGLLLWMSVLFLVISGIIYFVRYQKLVSPQPVPLKSSQPTSAQIDS